MSLGKFLRKDKKVRHKIRNTFCPMLYQLCCAFEKIVVSDLSVITLICTKYRILICPGADFTWAKLELFLWTIGKRMLYSQWNLRKRQNRTTLIDSWKTGMKPLYFPHILYTVHYSIIKQGFKSCKRPLFRII